MNFIVIGDVMIDKYYISNTNRISPEAPIPVFEVKNIEYKLGGAANVTYNLKSLNCDVKIISISGNDKNHEKIIELFDKNNIKNFIFKDISRKTTIKNRIISDNTIYSRFDIEDKHEINDSIETNIFNKIKLLSDINNINGIILSDYNKGLLTEKLCQNIIKFANDKNILTFIDPKINNINKYKNCTLFKPNLSEANLISSKENINEKIIDIYNKINCQIVLITLGKDGMIYYDGKNINYINNYDNNIKCVDVTGAGDSVLSAFVYYYCYTKNIEKSCKFSQFIGKKSVEFMGNYIIKLEDIYDFENNNKFNSKILNIKDLKEFKNLNKNKKIVFTNGCFDIMHIGHLKLLEFCKKNGDIVIVGLNSDNSIKLLKGEKRPINIENDRIEFLSILNFIDHIVVFEDETPYELLSQLKPNIMVKGGDYNIENIVGREFAEEILIFNFIEGKSTSNIIQKIITK